jgi:magnesium transporter
MAGSLERIIQDVLVDREILTQALNLQMSMLSHRTNKAMSRLAIVSTIFLPLTFLAGIYGMNFEIFPEIGWRYGYPLFWAECAVVVAVLLYLLRRARML